MHRYRLFEIDPDGGLHDTGKIVECGDLPRNEYGIVYRPIIEAVLGAYGFSRFLGSFRVDEHGKDFLLTYTARDIKPCWKLVKGE